MKKIISIFVLVILIALAVWFFQRDIPDTTKLSPEAKTEEVSPVTEEFSSDEFKDQLDPAFEELKQIDE